MTSQFRALTIQSGTTTQIQPTNELLVGQGIDTDGSGALTVGSTMATSVVLGGAAVTAVSVSGSATFATGTGAVTLAGDTTVSGSKTLTVGTGLTTLGGGLTVSSGTTTLSALNSAGVVHTDSSGVLSTSLIGNADVSGSAAIAYSKLNLTGSIVNADVSATAAIAGTKISPDFGSQNVTTSGNISTTGSGTVTSAGLLTASNGLTVSGTTTLSALNAAGVVLNSSSGVLSTLASTTDGYVLTWESGQWTAQSPGSTIALYGDVDGYADANTVVRIQGNPVSATPATAGQFLIENSSANGSAWTSLGLDVSASTSTPGAITVLTAQGSFTVGQGGSGNLTVKGTSSLQGTTTVTTGDIVVSTGNISTTAGTITSAGLLTASNGFTVSSGTITLTPVSTGVVLSTSGVISGSNGTDAQLLVAQSSGVPLWKTLAGDGYINDSGTLTITQAAGNFEVKGDLTVDGAETIVGTSSFQANATFHGDVVVADGYTLTANTVTSSAGNALTLTGVMGTDIQKNGTTYLDVGVTTDGVVTVPSGITVQAASGGAVVATSSAVAFTTVNGSDGYALYVSANDVASPSDSSAIASAYCVGFKSSVTGQVITDGLVTPVINGSATAGQVMYLDQGANAGKVTATAPSSGVVAPVGFMKNATQMIIRVLTPVQL